MRYTRTWQLYFATPLAFNAVDGGVSLADLRKNVAWRSEDGYGTKWQRNIAESFKPPSIYRAHKRYRRQTDLR